MVVPLGWIDTTQQATHPAVIDPRQHGSALRLMRIKAERGMPC
jgi:hypothetical protein